MKLFHGQWAGARGILPMLGLLVFIMGCSPPAPQTAVARTWSVAELYAHIADLKGKIVEVRGRFMGWSGCRDRTVMTTRSDWVLSGDGQCIFVTAGFPGNLDPRNLEDRGRQVTIRALVLEDEGRAYLRMVEP